jgi:DNA-binding NtrC family response regulator
MPFLVIAQGPKAGARYALDNDLVVGRSPSCDVSMVDNKMSRRHARLRLRGGHCTVADLGSRNGTFLNGERIEHESAVASGDRVQIGDTTFVYDPPMRAIAVDDSNLRFESSPVEELMPVTGATALVYQAATSVLAAPSESAVLRRAADAAMGAFGADVAAALLPGEQGLLTAAVVGAPEALIPRGMLRAAVERREVATNGTAAAAPLWSGVNAFGLIFVSRVTEKLSRDELGLLSALGRIAGEALTQARLRVGELDEDHLVGTSRIWRKAIEQTRRAASSNSPATISGEPGVGKALLGAYFHARSPRAAGLLVRVDCTEPAAHVQDELFGRPAGPGLPPLPSALARADGGTLMLLRIEALKGPAAERLARFLVRSVAPTLGGGEAPSDVRVVVTAGEPLEALVMRGDLDPQLGSALKGTAIHVPPLRERKGDVKLLFDFFAGRTARHLQRTAPVLSAETQRLLDDYAWPGNVRELRLCAERIGILSMKGEVGRAHLTREIQDGSIDGSDSRLGDLVGRVERDAIAAALRRAGGKKIRAAAILGISRPTLDKKIALYGLSTK